MKRPVRITQVALFALATLMASACETPVGLYGHKPEALWLLPTGPFGVELPRTAYTGGPIVLKRFENASLSPVGGHFVGDEPGPESMSQVYAPGMNLAPYLFEATYSSLRTGRVSRLERLPAERRASPGATWGVRLFGVARGYRGAVNLNLRDHRHRRRRAGKDRVHCLRPTGHPKAELHRGRKGADPTRHRGRLGCPRHAGRR